MLISARKLIEKEELQKKHDVLKKFCNNTINEINNYNNVIQLHGAKVEEC